VAGGRTGALGGDQNEALLRFGPDACGGQQSLVAEPETGYSPDVVPGGYLKRLPGLPGFVPAKSRAGVSTLERTRKRRARRLLCPKRPMHCSARKQRCRGIHSNEVWPAPVHDTTGYAVAFHGHPRYTKDGVDGEFESITVGIDRYLFS